MQIQTYIFKPKFVHNYDTYEFVNSEEERIYKIQCDWNDWNI